MTNAVTRCRVIVAVDPPLLADTLCRALAAADLDLVVFADGGHIEVSPAGTFDIAVVTGDVPANVSARAVIVLPETTGGPGLATVRSAGGERRVPAGGLSGLTDLIATIRGQSQLRPGT